MLLVEGVVTLMKDKNALLEAIKDGKTVTVSGRAYDFTGIDGDYKAPLTDAYKMEYETKDRFYRTIEAIDLYLKAFTQALTANIDDVKDIKKMLEGIEFIADFYREDAGNYLANIFDGFGSINYRNGNRETWNKPAKIPTGEHYYNSLDNDLKKVGIPYLGVDVKHLSDIKPLIGRFFDNFTALKNIIDVFARVGDKFGSSGMKIGGLELRQAALMSPTEIYKNLTDYLKISSFSIGTVNTTGSYLISTSEFHTSALASDEAKNRINTVYL